MTQEKNAPYVVRQGDCIYSIAAQHGFYWKTIWNYSANGQLKNERKNPNILLPGDIVQLPPKELKENDCPTENTHRFVVQKNLTKLRLRFLENDKPRANERYILVIDGRFTEGTTKKDGSLEEMISPLAKKGTLTLLPGEEDECIYELKLGGLDPKDEITGLQARLHNLGLPVEITGETDEQTVEALRVFQQKNGLPASGEPDQSTIDKIKELYGC